MSRLSIGLSLALHIALVLLLWNSAFDSGEKSFASRQGPLTVRSLTEKEMKELETESEARKRLQKSEQIVQSDDQLKDYKAPEETKEKIFLSKNNQRVDKNMRAAKSGEFKNVLDEGLESGEAKQEILKSAGAEAVKEKKKRSSKNLDTFDAKNLFALAGDYTPEEGINAEAKDRKPSSVNINPSVRKKGSGMSATDDYLEGVSVGANTLLNTQEFKYYSFYERIRVLLVDRWRSRIRKEIEHARSIASGDGQLSLGSKVTKLEVKLNRQGQITLITKLGISGIETFDSVAEQSFREAAPFPHPPDEMLKDDEVTVRWDFVVVVDEASPVQFNIKRSL